MWSALWVTSWCENGKCGKQKLRHALSHCSSRQTKSKLFPTFFRTDSAFSLVPIWSVKMILLQCKGEKTKPVSPIHFPLPAPLMNTLAIPGPPHIIHPPPLVLPLPLPVFHPSLLQGRGAGLRVFHSSPSEFTSMTSSTLLIALDPTCLSACLSSLHALPGWRFCRAVKLSPSLLSVARDKRRRKKAEMKKEGSVYIC